MIEKAHKDGDGLKDAIAQADEPEVTQEMIEAGRRAQVDDIDLTDAELAAIYRLMHKVRPPEWSVPIRHVLVRNGDGDLVIKAIEEKPDGLPPMAGKGVIERISCAIQDAMRSARTPSKGYDAAALVAYQIAEAAIRPKEKSET